MVDRRVPPAGSMNRPPPPATKPPEREHQPHSRNYKDSLSDHPCSSLDSNKGC